MSQHQTTFAGGEFRDGMPPVMTAPAEMVEYPITEDEVIELIVAKYFSDVCSTPENPAAHDANRENGGE